jgi:hypothetical protein
MIVAKRAENVPVELEMSLVEVKDFETLVPDAASEISRMYLLWDSVCLLLFLT